MRSLFIAVCLTGLLGYSTGAQAIGCISGAVAGGVAGHYAGHHAVIGAVGGCIAGHHAHKVMKQRRLEEQNAARRGDPAPAR